MFLPTEASVISASKQTCGYSESDDVSEFIKGAETAAHISVSVFNKIILELKNKIDALEQQNQMVIQDFRKLTSIIEKYK